MPRKSIPEDQLTDEQRKNRIRNQKHRQKKVAEKKLHLVNSNREGRDHIEKEISIERLSQIKSQSRNEISNKRMPQKNFQSRNESSFENLSQMNSHIQRVQKNQIDLQDFTKQQADDVHIKKLLLDLQTENKYLKTSLLRIEEKIKTFKIVETSKKIQNNFLKQKEDTLQTNISNENLKNDGSLNENQLLELISILKLENQTLKSAKSNSKNLSHEWISSLQEILSPKNIFVALAKAVLINKKLVNFTAIFLLIAATVGLSVHISGDFFGDKGFETALGVLIGGGILSVLAKTTTNIWQAVSFRFLAYIGTAAFLMVAYSGMKNSSLKDSEGYLASQKTINRIEAEIKIVSNNIASLAPEYGKLREKEYERIDKLKLELAQEQSKLRSITPNTHQDIAVIGNFIARFILDVVVFALFEVFAAQFLIARRRLKALS